MMTVVSAYPAGVKAHKQSAVCIPGSGPAERIKMGAAGHPGLFKQGGPFYLLYFRLYADFTQIGLDNLCRCFTDGTGIREDGAFKSVRYPAFFRSSLAFSGLYG